MAYTVEKLHKARAAHDDEFYTPYDTAADVMERFYKHGMRVLCPCDGEQSAFVQWCRARDVDVTYGEGNYEQFDPAAYDFVATNPPWSLLSRSFHAWIRRAPLYAYLAPVVSACYNCIVSDIATGCAGAIHLGSVWYSRPDGSVKQESTIIVTSVPQFHPQRPLADGVDPQCCMDDAERALNVDRLKLIPRDYTGWMFVPLTFAYQLYDPAYWELDEKSYEDVLIDGKHKFRRLRVRHKSVLQ